MSLNIFVDYHHNDLYYSLHLLFEKRLGGKLYRPIGMDWFHQGYWKIAEPYGNKLDTVGQYLDTSGGGWHQYERLNGDHYIDMNGVYRVWDPGHDYHARAITFDMFKQMKFDLIISSIPSHDACYPLLIRNFQPQAKHVAQMGNINQKTSAQNVMYTVPYSPRPGQNTVFYHQEVDPEQYKYVPPNPDTKNIYSMVNLLPDAATYHAHKAKLPEVQMKAYGAGCPDGSLTGCSGVAAKMQESNLGWHIKPMDGFGHTAMGWYRSGRFTLTKMSDIVKYGHDAPRLFEHGVTCHNLEAFNVDDNCAYIRRYLEPEENARLCENAKKRFEEVVNYDAEEHQIRQFLGRLL